ncbi:hypothetical protein O0I10_012863 [Lichtheimia ornata]|uniref:Uncharacterized protein n=1 Tax=Lichtheimia ornata TaxID=688661 RepID=A0AAD7UR72_9FUNG|nr:uncharacterized protein O0I10_012863 [Lichtheimia ornata]KAJ8651571.1 hypothetical protein O0I10_012863 [Lichtheimia ornata]
MPSSKILLLNLVLLFQLWILPMITDAATASLSCNRPCQDINRDPIPAGSKLDLTWQFANHYLPERFDIVLAWGLRTNALNTLITYLDYEKPTQDAQADTYKTSLTLPPKLPSGDYYWIILTPYDAANYSDYTTNFGPYTVYGSDEAMNKTRGPSYPFELDVQCSGGKCGQGGNTIEMGGPLLVSWSYEDTFRMALYWGSPDILGETATAVVQLFPSLNCTKDRKYGVSISTQSILNLVPPGPYYYIAVESTSSSNVRSLAGPYTIKSSAAGGGGGGTSDASKSWSSSSFFTPLIFTFMILIINYFIQ